MSDGELDVSLDQEAKSLASQHGNKLEWVARLLGVDTPSTREGLGPMERWARALFDADKAEEATDLLSRYFLSTFLLLSLRSIGFRDRARIPRILS